MATATENGPVRTVIDAGRRMRRLAAMNVVDVMPWQARSGNARADTEELIWAMADSCAAPDWRS
ncbi:hypothetical protein [Streptomyces sp. HB132]|uniref:hypothetical protein n=1 Tax=Streptomyces sp. HB132 TaxID=767388 RepID=UPI001961667F|nr:hypothetical protein [Streptomyces sp. HB132]MBM7443035.1 hypothetical protein [Streptomyces sp. HB132]